MAFYTDKLPDTCANCKCINVFEDSDGRINHVCNILNQVVSIQKRLSNCPLKELTDAQLAVGWLQNKGKIQNDNKNIHYFMDDEGWVYREDVDGLFHHSADELYKILFTSTWTLLEKPQFIYTDWKGAREASKKGAKVTIVEKTLFGSVSEELRLFYVDGSGYYLKADNGDSYGLVDKVYDSTKWKVWS